MPSVSRAWPTARLAIPAACAACWLMSLIEEESCCGSRRHRIDAHRGLAGSLFGDLDALVGLARDRRQAGRGGPHLAGGVAELVERLAHHAFELADIALDRLLPRRGAGIAFALLRLDPDLVGCLLLEGLQRAGQRADFVVARGVAGIDVQVAGRDLQHGVAHAVQRLDDAAGDEHLGAEGERQRADEQRELRHQRALGRGAQMGGVILGGVERAFGHGDGSTEASDRDRGPLVGRHFRLLAGCHLLQQPLAQGEILRLEIGRLGRGHGAGDRRRQLHSGRGQLQGIPRGLGAAVEFGEGDHGFRRDLVRRQARSKRSARLRRRCCATARRSA